MKIEKLEITEAKKKNEEEWNNYLKKKKQNIPINYFSWSEIISSSFFFQKPLFLIGTSGLARYPIYNEVTKKYWDVNVGGTICLLKVLEEYSCKKLIFSSSATIYSPNCISPIGEEQIIDPINPYGETKTAVEKLLDSIFKVDLSKDLKKHDKEIKFFLENEFISRKHFQKGRIEASIKKDPHLEQALEVLKNPNKYNQILGIN